MWLGSHCLVDLKSQTILTKLCWPTWTIKRSSNESNWGSTRSHGKPHWCLGIITFYEQSAVGEWCNDDQRHQIGETEKLQIIVPTLKPGKYSQTFPSARSEEKFDTSGGDRGKGASSWIQSQSHECTRGHMRFKEGGRRGKSPDVGGLFSV